MLTVNMIVLAAIGSRRPLGGEAGINTLARADDLRPTLERPTGNCRTVSAGYFRALGIPLVAGRTFDERDRERQVVVVSQRTASRLWPGELAIRAALGAQPAQLVGQVVSSGMKPVAVGLATGVIGALFLGKGLSSVLLGVDPRDPATIAAVSALLAVVAGAACYFPARKASHADPITALRSE